MLEKVIDFFCRLCSYLPAECMEFHFMQMALLAILLLAPLSASAGVQVINLRMAFFADTIGHSAFAGAALGLILLGANGPAWAMQLLALLIGLGVMYLQRSTHLSSDTAIGILFAFIVSGGLLLTAQDHELAHLAQSFIFGDILLIDHQDIALLALLALLHTVFMICNYNRMLLIAVDEDLARAHGIKTALCNYLHISLLALIVIVSVKALGVLLVSAMLTVPAATARNLTTKAGTMPLCAAAGSLLCAVCALLISVHEKVNISTGAAIVMLNCILFAASCAVKQLRKRS